jgi:hypothetical protein
MAVKPILFSTPMVQAILAGRKTMTRRLVSPQPEDHSPVVQVIKNCTPAYNGDRCDKHWFLKTDYYNRPCDGTHVGGYLVKPLCEVGDILWVRETWAKHGYGDFCLDGFDDLHNDNPQYDDGGIMGLGAYIFKADGVKSYEEQGEEPIKWRPSIHMPKEACRLFLRVTDVRAEQLQEITEEDAMQEGFVQKLTGKHGGTLAAHIQFENTWDDLYSKRGYGWDANPWVWVYTFERCEKPEGWC